MAAFPVVDVESQRVLGGGDIGNAPHVSRMETPNLVADNLLPTINNFVPSPEVINSIPISSSCLTNL